MVAETGVVIEVVRRRFGFHSFFTAFPESEREALAARWKLPFFGFGGDGASGNVGGGHGGHGGH
jgi:hypothetical protein